MPALAQAAAERLPDGEVKKIIDQIDEARDKFENDLDGNFKNSNVRWPSGQVRISNLLQDYPDDTKKLKERFKDDYPATADGHFCGGKSLQGRRRQTRFALEDLQGRRQERH
jgi:hypothetical protein